jgi:hypothetical protein
MSIEGYFPNKWEMYNEAPPEMFEQHSFEEVMDWKVGGWELPSDVVCIVRATNVNTGKTREYTYRRQDAAERRIEKLMEREDIEIIIAGHEAVHHLYPE